MSDSTIYIPISRTLYDDIIRFSDGRLDPSGLAENLLENWIANDLQFGVTGEDYWGDRFEDVAAIYAPSLLERSPEAEAAAAERQKADSKPLVWKGITFRAGSEVRMHYKGVDHFAQIRAGAIVDAEGVRYTPSRWASKVANGTSRNAWRDIQVKEPQSSYWISAEALRDAAMMALRDRTRPMATPNPEDLSHDPS